MNHKTLFLDDVESGSDGDTRIKICGITRADDALHAANAGAHAIGLIFYEPSSRNLTAESAARIREQLPDTVSSVAVVVNPDDDLLGEIVSIVKPDYIQYHGDESLERCEEGGIPFIKALRVRSTNQIAKAVEQYTSAQGFLLDAYEIDRVGGTGVTFAWDLIPNVDVPIILAGGLNSRNIVEAIHSVRPSAVDVSTGVEVSGGIKDPKAIKKFVAAVRKANENVSFSNSDSLL